MTAIDTSIAVPALLVRHPHHDHCHAAARDASLPVHALIETYSVLTRMPAGLRVAGETARRALRERFPSDRLLVAPDALQRTLLDRFAGRIVGGAVYHALVALTAAEHDHRLLTRDRRAADAYRTLGIDFELIAP